jgi:protein gp37
MLPLDWGEEGYPNVWLGFTAEDQERFDERSSILQQVPAVVWFVSYEPAIGPLRFVKDGPRPHWLIAGGESGYAARPMKAAWVRNIIADCREFGVVPFFKQWGSYQNNPLVTENGWDIKRAQLVDARGKGGCMLDGKLIRDFPVSKIRQVEEAAAA